MSNCHLIVATVLAVLVLAAPAAAADSPAAATSATQVRLGAGDELGYAVFSRYVAAIQSQPSNRLARLRFRAPNLSARAAQSERWVMAVRMGNRVVHYSGTEGSGQITVLPLPAQTSQPQSSSPI